MTEETTPRRRRRSPIWALLLLVALAVTMAGIFPFRQIIAQDRHVELTQQKLDALLAENERLADTRDLLATDAEIERIARERFGLVRPGETVFVVEWVPGTEPPPEPELPPADARAWYEKFWDFATGRDFDPDA